VRADEDAVRFACENLVDGLDRVLEPVRCTEAESVVERYDD
jgi:hypothetical protein